MFKKVDSKMNFPEMEKGILNFWEENKIFEKSVENRKDCPLYTFYDGPPFATGSPHYGHLVGSAMKDIVPRFWTMKGRYVPRVWGWDCHGLPIENIVEKELGSKAKKDIEKLGVDKFNELCRSKVLEYVADWKKTIRRFGRWADMENAYKTMDLSYMESVWWVFKELYDKGLVYEGYRSMHICPRCETTLSQSEVAEGYKDVKDLSVVAKFKINYMLGKTGRGVGALITNDKGEILLIHRNEKGRKITWALPGGKVEKGETFREAVEREVKEELGVEIQSLKAFVKKPYIFEGRLFETVCYEVKVKSEPKNMVPDEADKIGWFSIDKLPKMDYPSSDDNIDIYKKNLQTDVDENIENQLPKVYALAWTTTPWTLIGNVALAINKNISYVMVKSGDEYFILAKERLEEVFKNNEYEIMSEIKGEHLVGLSYEPLFDYYAKDEKLANHENGWKIYAGDFVTTEEGTGIVHIAPAFGEDDMNLGKKEKLPFIQHVGMDGIIRPEAEDFSGMHVKPENDTQKTDVEIIKYLAKKNLLFAKEKYEHSYPHCWRCETPLINYATSSWFVNVEKIKKDLLKNAEKINWSPAHIKNGRFGNWLESARDWSISRQRFWASVMPIWKCDCGEIKVIGSVKKLEELSGEKISDIHKHVVDKITFKCKCGGEMKRIPDVLDTWFDSGSMPYAQIHYPFENKEVFEKGFPAEFIAEGVDQTRCWFYYLHLISTGIKSSRAYNNVVVNGIVLAEDGKKMAKRLKNYPDPNYVLEKYGADALRFYLTSSSVMQAENLNFKESDLADLVRGMFRMLWNSYSFFILYANIDKFESRKSKVESRNNLLDRWIISELNMLIKEINANMENYELTRAARCFPKFIDNLSNWYIRRSRKRFWKSENDTDKNEAYETLYYVLITLAKSMAPFTPFVAEEIWRNLSGCHAELVSASSEEIPKQVRDDNFCSVHLENFPLADEKMIDEKLNEEMANVRAIISEGLQLRAKAGIKVRQPLQEVRIKKQELSEELRNIIKEELNVKEVIFDKKQEEEVKLKTEITPGLKLEGQAREVVRFIQEMRKEAGYEVDNRIRITYSGESEIFNNLELKKLITKETLANEILSSGEISEVDLKKTFEIDGKKIEIGIRKI
ncbi:MAG TPA: isoleucine--tRNA ligase [Candidatus Moranbacteria bacterium]|nr:isoleucine--tRNA ligase [Candidatus Moranbacteria bacterium]